MKARSADMDFNMKILTAKKIGHIRENSKKRKKIEITITDKNQKKFKKQNRIKKLKKRNYFSGFKEKRKYFFLFPPNFFLLF